MKNKIEEADQLFDAKQYIDAYKIYDNLLEDDQVFSSRMLLRMSYIQEGQGNYSLALYLLNLQYRLTADRQTSNKMSKIASDHNLLGYQYSDKEYFTSFFNKKKVEIGIGVIVLLGICLVLMYLRRREQHSITTLTFGVAVISLLGLWAFNGGVIREQGIVMPSGALLMDGPSAGSKNISKLVPGERVMISGETDIWYKVTLPNEATGFLRKGRVFDVK
ncbi:SH3 domain-containing protein [Flammeovirga pectinis]|uniref:SH3 domain-containing protein n=1 Tax=Flammeovirga pectinis TaxID=2494373 RepID=A0A3S9P5L3_9BACT|nr:SH3 domain-containing protein [Flammeovirga pectinis]AZQ63468.1 SH3 domain-containing protein [Flammeovirga pectinis]